MLQGLREPPGTFRGEHLLEAVATLGDDAPSRGAHRLDAVVELGALDRGAQDARGHLREGHAGGGAAQLGDDHVDHALVVGVERTGTAVEHVADHRRRVLASASHADARATEAELRMRSATAVPLRKFSRKKEASVWPNCSLRATTIAVCGIGSPSGRRKSATTANQSARAPTIEASSAART